MTTNTWKRLSWKRNLFRLPALALLLCAPAAFAVAPSVVVATQLDDTTGLNNPQSLVVGPKNTIYAADTGNNRVVMFADHAGTPVVVSTGTFTLVSPNAVAVDSLGDLFIGDSPKTGTGRVLEAMANNGVLNGTVKLVVMGGKLEDVFALTVDTNPGSATFNTLYIGDDLSNAIYTVAAGSTTLTPSGITGLPAGVVPAALAKDASGNLYIADFLTTLYEVPSGSLAAQTYVAPGFTLNSPTGLAIDGKGDIFILTLLVPFGTSGGTGVENVVEVPQGDPTSVYLVPLNPQSINNASAVGVDTDGDLYIPNTATGDIVGVFYGSAFDLNQANVGSVGTPVLFNYEFNAPLTVTGFKFVSGGDTSTEIVNSGGTCSNGTFTDGSNGGAISPSNPFLCQQSFSAQPIYPGLRPGAVELESTGNTILNTTPVFSVGAAGASVVYPLTASIAISNINTPQGMAVSGLNQELYIVNADPGHAQILSASGPGGQTLTVVSTSPVVLGTPAGIAINGAGDLYVADFANSHLAVIPATGQTPFVDTAGGLLQHPYSVAFDMFGNLYIGDAGPRGADSDAADPGYIVEIPVGGGPAFKVNTGTTVIIDPKALATDPYTGDLYIGDSGNESGNGAKVVKVAAANGAVSVVTPVGVTAPVGIVFDAAEQYYVLDQNAGTITVVPPTGKPFSLPFDNSLFTTPVSLAALTGGQSLVEANASGHSNNLIYLNGILSPLAFGSVRVGTQSDTLTATVDNIGNLPLTLLSPFFSSNETTSPFDILASTKCAGGDSLAPTVTCAINVQFKPTAAVSSTETLTLNTNGYNNGSSVINLSGTGTRGFIGLEERVGR
jgi:sugar lactone lactonase YvrE